MRVSVSNLDLYNTFKGDEDFPLNVFLAQLRGESPKTAPMLRGIAFARAMEKVGTGESSILEADGYQFGFTCDVELPLWPRRETRAEKDYGGITVSARCDRILGRVIQDDKTTERFDCEGYLDKWQPFYYMDMFGADRFDWHIWQVKELDTPKQFEVFSHDLLSQYRYPNMEKDCRDFAQEFKGFAERAGIVK